MPETSPTKQGPTWRISIKTLALRVFPGQLRSMRAIQAFFVVLKPGIARPCPLQVVPHSEMQSTKALDLQFNLVAVHEGIEPPMIGPCRHQIARRKSVDRAEPLYASRNLVRHIIRIEVLHQGSVVPEPYLQVLRILSLIHI